LAAYPKTGSGKRLPNQNLFCVPKKCKGKFPANKFELQKDSLLL
jgi:hypothetical protein